MYKELQPIEESYRKLGLDRLKEASEVDQLLKEGHINSNTADYLKHTIQRRTEAASNPKTLTIPHNINILLFIIIIVFFLESGDYWKRIFLFIGIPSIALVAINTYFTEERHAKHLEEHPPAFTPYEHMKIRTRVQNSNLFIFKLILNFYFHLI